MTAEPTTPGKPFTRGFRIEFPDGFHVDGAQFPSGRVVLDDVTTGLIEAAVSLDDLATLRGRLLAQVVWADGGGRDA